MDIDTAAVTGRDLVGLVETVDPLADRVVVAARTTDVADGDGERNIDGLRVAGGLAGAIDRLTAAVVFLLGAAEHAAVVAERG